MQVKICGLTNADDALAALAAGADLLGFIFYPPSPRAVAPAACARIVAAVRAHAPAAVTVGVFVNEAPARVAAVLDECGLDLAQLHGDEPPEHLRLLAGRAYKGLRGLDRADPALFAPLAAGAPTLLIDGYSPTLYGGAGRTADWDGAARVAARFPLLLAGGLTPANVLEAVRRARPWGVDTASGVERAPGRKDHQKIAAFVAAARTPLPQRHEDTKPHEDR